MVETEDSVYSDNVSYSKVREHDVKADISKLLVVSSQMCV